MKLNDRILPYLRSLRFRIFLLALFSGILPSYLAIFSFLSGFEDRQVNAVVTTLMSQAQLINSQIISSGYLNQQNTLSMDVQLNALDNIYAGRIMVLDTSLRIVKDTYGIYEGKTMIWENAVRGARGESVSDYDKENLLITVAVPVISNQGKENEEILGVLIITRNTESIEQDMHFYESLALILTLIIAVTFLFVAILISNRFVRPLRRVSEQIDRLESGTVSELGAEGYTETKEISAKFDHFTRHLRNLDNARQEFVSNVSHELKTPLTAMKLLADSLTAGGDDTPVEFYREFMTDIASEIDRETQIIDDLLALVKLDKDAGDLNITAVNVNEVIERIMKQLRPLAEHVGVELVLESFRPVTVELDELKFSQAIVNLIENAIKYNVEDGWVHVSINADYQYCYIRVEDSGIGIPEEALDSIFERFYRADKSHSKEIEGTGLGLAITRSAILLLGGEIKVDSKEGEGTSFAIRLPLIYIREER